MIEIRPYITEKTVDLAKKGMFTVLVDGSMSKPAICAKIKQYFKVSPQSVRTSVSKSVVSKNRKGTKQTSRGFKKAIIFLNKGESIPGFETFTKTKEKKEKSKNKK